MTTSTVTGRVMSDTRGKMESAFNELIAESCKRNNPRVGTQYPNGIYCYPERLYRQASVIIGTTFPDPVTDTVAGFLLWLVKSIAWVSAVLIVFLPLLVWNVLKVADRDRSVSAHLSMSSEIAASVDDQMKSFLRNALSNPSYGVAKCYVFGSVVKLYPTRPET